MAEYIKREQLKEHILEDIKLCGEPDSNLRPIGYGTILGLKYALNYLDALPTADVVEVVRCKDCELCDIGYPKKDIGKEAELGYFCLLYRCCKKSNDFCSYGERKECAKLCETCKYKSDCFLAKDNYKVEECNKYKEETEVSE